MIKILWDNKTKSNENEESKKFETIALKIKKDKYGKVKIVLDLSLEEYKKMVIEGLFNYSDDIIKNKSRDSFDDNSTIKVELKLNKDILNKFSEKINEYEENLENYFTETNNQELFDNSNWYILSATQEEILPKELEVLGKVRSGYSTIWKDE